MAKTRTQFICNHCGSVHPKWLGKCPDCGTWDALEEFKAPTPDARAAAAAQTGDLARGAEALTLAEIDEAEAQRVPTGIGEFDRILGGGIVPGSAVLVGGEPGIGKSTLLLQVAHAVSEDKVAAKKGDKETMAAAGRRVLYVTSEESARQTKLRA